MTQLHWKPGHSLGFEGLYAEGSGGYRYHVVLNPKDIGVTEISTYDDWEVVTRYARMDRDLDAARQFAQSMEDQYKSKPNVARMAKELPPGQHPGAPGRMDFRTSRCREY